MVYLHFSIHRTDTYLCFLKFCHQGNNKLTGSIPSEIGFLTGLTTLELEMNNLTGTVPSEILNLGIETFSYGECSCQH